MKRKSYPSDLSEAEWRLLEPLLPPPKPGGRPIKYARREVVNGIRYVLLIWFSLPPKKLVIFIFASSTACLAIS